ncbi:MAG TPA: ABC transporter permease, partial [Pseudodesulfovibrio sp.]|nr:ABC transporter permease [Pseudodesulfovibrio sp.]
MQNKRKSLWGQVFVRLKKNRMALVGLAILFALLLTALFANVIAPFPYDEQDLFATLQGPSLQHWFGTDEFGRDIFSRIIFGSRISLQVGFVAVGFSVAVGGFLGAVAGYYGGKIDNVIMRVMDVLLSIPQLLLAISVAASLGPGLLNLMLAVGIAAIPQYARLVRASVLSIRDQEFV